MSRFYEIFHVLLRILSVESFHEVEVSDEMWSVLQVEKVDGTKLSKQLQNELLSIPEDLIEATRRVLRLIKYCFGQTKLDEKLILKKDICWSVDESEWKNLPMLSFATVDVRNNIQLNENTARLIQNYLQDGFEPFLALRHLHRSIEEDVPRHKWIDATIAAELAVKEFLIRHKPELETLLLELPSPPLSKLYHRVLEHYAGESSPKRKELDEGAQIRNRLIHRPQDVDNDA